MAVVTGDQYLELLSSFVDRKSEALLEGAVVLKLSPVGLLYLRSRLDSLEELEDLRANAPVDYLRAYVSDLGDLRKLEKLRRFLKLLESLKIVSLHKDFRDPTPINLLVFSSLRVLELHGCNLSASAAKGLLELRPSLEELICNNSTDALRHIFVERSAAVADAPPWPKLAHVSCPNNSLLLMDDSLGLLTAVQVLDLSRNQFAGVANLHNCMCLHYLDLSFNRISSVAALNRILGNVTKLILRNNALVSTRGLEKLYALEGLDLSNNLLSSSAEIERLGGLPNLESLLLQGNPIALLKGYRIQVLSCFPANQQVVLDGQTASWSEQFVSQGKHEHKQGDKTTPPLLTPADLPCCPPNLRDASWTTRPRTKHQTRISEVPVKITPPSNCDPPCSSPLEQSIAEDGTLWAGTPPRTSTLTLKKSPSAATLRGSGPWEGGLLKFGMSRYPSLQLEPLCLTSTDEEGGGSSSSETSSEGDPTPQADGFREPCSSSTGSTSSVTDHRESHQHQIGTPVSKGLPHPPPEGGLEKRRPFRKSVWQARRPLGLKVAVPRGYEEGPRTAPPLSAAAEMQTSGRS